MYDTTYDTNMYYTAEPSSGEVAGAMAAFFVFFLITLIIAYVVNAILLGMVFKKAGIESWKAWVPIYNAWVLYEMGDQPGWWSILSLVPFVNFVAAVFLYIAMYKIGLKFGKEGIFVLLAIFFPLIWFIWLAVDKNAVWKPAVAGGSTPPESPAAPSQPAAM